MTQPVTKVVIHNAASEPMAWSGSARPSRNARTKAAPRGSRSFTMTGTASAVNASHTTARTKRYGTGR